MFGQLTWNIRPETIERIIKVEDPKNFNLSNIKRGIVSIHAQWSGPSVAKGKYILKLIEESSDPELEIYIIDIDEIEREVQEEKFGFFSHGYYESVWVENGEIEFNHRGKTIDGRYLEFNELLKSKLNYGNSNLSKM